MKKTCLCKFIFTELFLIVSIKILKEEKWEGYIVIFGMNHVIKIYLEYLFDTVKIMVCFRI